MARRDECAGFFVAGIVCATLLGACNALGGGGSTSGGGFRLPVADAAAQLRQTADSVERYDLTPRDGYIDELEWADLVVDTGIRLRQLFIRREKAAEEGR